MDMAGSALGEAALAGSGLFVSGAGGGTTYGESMGETTASGDALLPRGAFAPVLSEIFGISDTFFTQATVTSSLEEEAALGDVSSVPGGTIPEVLSGTIGMTDTYAASGRWTVLMQPAGGWSAASPAAPGWAVVPLPSDLWLKH
jgi:hypothetical protein